MILRKKCRQQRIGYLVGVGESFHCPWQILTHTEARITAQDAQIAKQTVEYEVLKQTLNETLYKVSEFR